MNEQIDLAPPGAGLPELERRLARRLLLGMRAGLSQETLTRWLRRETATVLALAAGLPAEQGKRRVLAPRLSGLEENSRYWSVDMVVQHLVIVDTGIGQLVRALVAGQRFAREVRIADVKPDAGAGMEQQTALRRAVDDYVAMIGALGKLASTATHSHPWFGELDARGWHALAALHSTVHRRQIQAIIARLDAPSRP